MSSHVTYSDRFDKYHPSMPHTATDLTYCHMWWFIWQSVIPRHFQWLVRVVASQMLHTVVDLTRSSAIWWLRFLSIDHQKFKSSLGQSFLALLDWDCQQSYCRGTGIHLGFRSSVNSGFSETTAWIQAKFCCGKLPIYHKVLMNLFLFSLTWDPIGAVGQLCCMPKYKI